MSDIADNHMVGILDGAVSDAPESVERIMPGAQLAAQRLVLGWSIEQVSEQLKLAPRQVIAIEQDNYEALPGWAVTRGFIRAYAKLLKLEVAPLLALMTQDVIAVTAAVPLRRALPTTFSEARLPMLGNRREMLTRWNVGVAVLILLLLIALLAQQMNWIPALPDSLVVNAKKELVPVSPPALPAVASAEDATVDAAVNVSPVSVVGPQIAAEAIAVEKGVPLASGDPMTLQVAESVNRNQLLVKIHEDSWIDVRQKNGVPVLSRLLKAGATQSFDVGEGLFLTVGNASGVEVLLRGESLEIKSGAKNNIARIKLK